MVYLMQYTQQHNGLPLMFHHARNIEHVVFDRVFQYKMPPLPEQPEDHEFDWMCMCSICKLQVEAEFQVAYEWLMQKTGFFPLFVGVGNSVIGQRITGYYTQWQRENGKEVRPERVLFSFASLPEKPVYSDYTNWCIVLNSLAEDGKSIDTSWWTKGTETSIFRPGWSAKRWHTHAKQYAVQAVVKQLDLRNATLVRCRNQKTAQKLCKMGWPKENILVERWPVTDHSIYD